jgi:leucine dehydrogenase
MNSAIELEGYNEDRALRSVARIRDIIARILALASRSNIPTWQAARKLAEERIAAISRIKQTYVK